MPVPSTATTPPPEPIVETIEVVEEVEEVPEIICSCIHGARDAGAYIPIGTNAWDIEGNTTPHVGALALFSYDPDDYRKDHVGVITSLHENGFWMYDENYNNPEGGCRAGLRYVLWSDPAITGFASL